MQGLYKDKKLLIVDDSVVARMGIKRMIESEFQTITEASTGAEAIDILSKDSYDLILMDYLMPGLNGLVTLKIIREKGNSTPIIIISANQQESILSKFKELGIDYILRKHVNKRDLIDAINQAFNSEGN